MPPAGYEAQASDLRKILELAIVSFHRFHATQLHTRLTKYYAVIQTVSLFILTTVSMLSHKRQLVVILATSAVYQIYYFLYYALPRHDDVGTPLLSEFVQAADMSISSTGRERKSTSSIPPFVKYYELSEEIEHLSQHVPHNSETSFNGATSIVDDNDDEATWFQSTKNCTETCCVTTVAISMDHEERHLLNTMDGLDLADVVLRNNPGPRHLQFHASLFHIDVIPCLQPGTIIHLNNNNKILRYFWRKIRPQIKVPFVLLTSDSDGNSPTLSYVDRLETDPLLLRWYGQNPHIPNEGSLSVDALSKFRPMPLGLSMNHPQAKYLKSYLDLTNYSNPFQDMSRFLTEQPIIVDWDRDVIMFFARRRDHRKALWAELCSNVTTATTDGTSSLSCSNRTVSPSEIYAEASRYKFGLSPPGKGWDCYRTYEWLYLGIIPVIEDRPPYSAELFDGLPVIHFPNLSMTAPETTIKADLMAAMETFLKTQRDLLGGRAGSNTAVGGGAPGWHRLFLAYWRRKILEDAARPTIFDGDGKEHYIGYRYETTVRREPIYCSKPGNCVNH